MRSILPCRKLLIILLYYFFGGAMRRCIVRFLSRGSTKGFSITRNVNEKRTRVRATTRPRGPQKPPFLACQKVAPPPCKKCTKSAFPGRKVGIFGRFVH